MNAKDAVARNLTAAFLAGPWRPAALRRRGEQALGQSVGWLGPLVRRLRRSYPHSPPADPEVLARQVRLDRAFDEACGRHFNTGETLLGRRFWLAPRMSAPRWPVPVIATTGALAEWLGIAPEHLDWFADCQGREARTAVGPLRHYHYHWVEGRRGKRRLLEVPKARLKAMQRKLLHELLDHVPAHEAAHGYRAGRSVVSYAAPHAGRRIVLRMDLRDFFPSVRGARVRALFRTVGYPVEVARYLAGLCTNSVPDDVWPADATVGASDKRPWFRSPHLPQGAPTSPAVANLCAHRLDRRLTGLAAKVGAAFTRYADDLAFSGGEELEHRARAFHVAVCRVALDEGFEVNTRKTRFMRRSARQHLAGVVVNEKVNCRRGDYDRLKAILTNCARHGPASQDRGGAGDFKASLLGQIAHLARLSPTRAARLRALFARVEWPV